MNSNKRHLAVGLLISTVLIVGFLLVFSKMYFTHLEVKGLTSDCYDRGGLVSIERTTFTIESFSCSVK
ncbi:hypothetical protein [Halobacillus massiliensis]|uniref:hypothetical protein n=1 Tax=Halobacillus massiliensis TaxID=1926286 RepID=UPI0009E2496C|nr:hypothetical protein [Halobacillus massiliensis]